MLMKRVPKQKLDFLTASVSTFIEMKLADSVDLIYASYSLLFCRPEKFPLVWKTIIDHISIGGRFAGNFFGDKDSWADIPGRTHHSYQQVLELFQDHFEIEYFE